MPRQTSNHTIVGNLKKQVISYPSFRVSKDRICRVYLPSDYDSSRKEPYKVLYMFDGQNLFDKATSAFNQEWKIDETIEEKLKEGYPSMVVVGMYNSKDRESEYTPNFGYSISSFEYEGQVFNCDGDKTADFLINHVIPTIENKFNCGGSKEKRLVGGSSAGGNMTTYMAYQYPEYFQYYLSFSTAFHLYNLALPDDKMFKRVVSTFLDKKHLNKFSYILSAGGRGQEADYTQYVEKMIRLLIEGGFNKDLLGGLVDTSFKHNEKQWAFFFNKIYSFIAN